MPEATPLQLLPHVHWESDYSQQTLARGRAYADNGHVLSCILDRETDHYRVSGQVRGSHGNIWECDIVLAEVPGGLLIEGLCDCPVGFNCKHAAAMLYWLESGNHLADEPDRSDIRQWERWLQELEKPRRERKPGQAEPMQRFGVMLNALPDKPLPRLLALPAWLRPSKRRNSQAMVSPKAVTMAPHQAIVPTPADGWDVATAAALVSLLNAWVEPTGNNLPWRLIQAEHEEAALEHLLEHYPVWYQRGSQPLQRGDNLALQWQWQEAADGNQRLMPTLEDPETELLHAAGLWYVQSKAGRYGRVDGDPALLLHVLHAPVLEPGQVPAVGKRLQSVAALQQMPAPVQRGPVETVDAAPQPVLSLRKAKVRDWDGAKLEVGVARLGFAYGDLRLGAHGPLATRQRQLHDGKLWQVQRDRDGEAAALRKLRKHDLYFSPQVYNIADGELDRDDLLLVPKQRGVPRTPEQWRTVLKALQADGFRLEFAAGFPHDELVEIDDWYGELAPSGNAWFDVSLGIDVGGERIDMLPILRRLLADPKFPFKPGAREKKNATWRVKLDAERSVKMPLKRLRAMMAPLLEWLQGDAAGEPRIHRSRAAELDDAALPWHGGKALRAHLDKLADARKPAATPRGFKAELRPYQRDGLAWLNFLARADMGGILADDMGLGKTVQVLAHILAEKQAKRLPHPALVVAPTSLVGNWTSEAERFAPRLKVLVIHGQQRAPQFAEIGRHDLVISTYPLLPRDREQWLEHDFSLLVLDEAQAIKNPKAQAARVVRDIKASRRLAMTGTPLENHLGELWAQFDAVEPGLLGSQRSFRKHYRTPIEKHGDGERQQRLNRRIGSLLLRRTKDQVLTELPPKNEIVRHLELQGAQRQLYETLRLAQHKRVTEAVRERGLAQSGIIVLDALLKLRQACCDPRLVKLDSARKLHGSVKLEALLELLDGLLAEGRRILLFSQFTEMLGLIQAALDKRKIPYQSLTGQTPGNKRAALVKDFQDGKVPLFLVSLKAGGVGLNLTAADTVIHYDPWWNPAVEAQATDRAHRIGQDKPVFVYRLICAGTVEEKIQKLQQRKAGLAKAVLEGGASKKLRFDQADLAELFGPA